MTPKLLLADDSVTIQRVIELTFADEDVQVLAVGDGRQAIERVQSERPDIVLADVGMPEQDGYEVAAFIKSNPQLAHIPVLLLTGAFEPIDEVRARAVGCDGVLVKPFEPQMVISRVRDLLSGNRDADLMPPSGAERQPASHAHHAPAAPTDNSVGATLEDYFDRLDAALANKSVPAPPVDVRIPPPPPARAVPAEPPRIRPIAPVAAPAPSVEPPAPAPVPVTAPTAAPAAAAPKPAAPPAPAVELSLQEAFAALLGAEQSAASESPARVERLSSEAIDEIATRVIARLGDDSMRSTVLDVAERLVRDEIARIKAQ
ncbi:MAG TPA: response regulator [Vicinamibacterales bacterium]